MWALLSVAALLAVITSRFKSLQMAVTRPGWLSDCTAEGRLCLKSLYCRYAMPKVHSMDCIREGCTGQADKPRCRHWKTWSNRTGKNVLAKKINDCFWNVVGGDDLNVIRAKLNGLINDDSSDVADPALASIPLVKPVKYHRGRGQPGTMQCTGHSDFTELLNTCSPLVFQKREKLNLEE